MKRNAYIDNIGAKLHRQELEEGEPKTPDVVRGNLKDECQSVEPEYCMSCKKKSYANKREAEDAALRQRHLHGWKNTPYECEATDGVWHLTSQDAATRDATTQAARFRDSLDNLF